MTWNFYGSDDMGLISGKLKRLDNGQFEYPQNNVEYVAPTQLFISATQTYPKLVKRIYFNFSDEGAAAWHKQVDVTSLEDILDANIQLRTANPSPEYGYHATANTNRYWYLRGDLENNHFNLDIGSDISGVRGWVDYI